MARRKKRQPENRGIFKREEVKADTALSSAASEEVTESEDSSAAEEAEEPEDSSFNGGSSQGEAGVKSAEPEKPEPVITESAGKKPELKINKIETESKTLTEEKETQAGMVTDAMPEFLRSSNSTIRRDGPYANYSGNADVLRHKNKDGESGTERRSKKKGKRRKRDAAVSTETISLVALIVILGAIFVCAIRHVEMRELSLVALLITAIITIAMGVLLGDTPAYVTLIVVALIIIAGAITGMFSEVITGVVMFLGTVLAIKGRFE